MTDAVLVEELATACGRRFGVATLDAGSALNALTLEMVRALAQAFRRWADDRSVVGVVLQSSSDKAFCAGADLRTLSASIRASAAAPSAYACDFFAEEYRLDHGIHTYAKPVLCWGHGIVMGGGIGLMVGASHRVVTPESRLAMPEISIGLFPDVAGSWFLRRMPGRTGLFLALTGASFNSADAMFGGIADFELARDRRGEVLAAIGGAHWTDSPRENRAALSRLLAERARPRPVASNLRQHFDQIQALMAGDDLGEIAARLRSVSSDDVWLMQAAANFAAGSPTSAALAFELWHRVLHLSLADVFRLEYLVALGCCSHADLVEGIRALLIDKDRKPRWQPASIDQVTREIIEDHLRPRFEGPHPLAVLTPSVC